MENVQIAQKNEGEKFEVTESFVIREIAEKTFLVPLVRDINETPFVYSINEAASMILEFVKNNPSSDIEEELGSIFLEEFSGLTREEAVNDIHETLEDFRAIGLIKVL